MQQLPPALAGLAEYPQFLLYKISPNARTGKNDKFPCDHTGKVVDAHDRSHWMSAEYATGWAAHHGLGVAFVLADSDPFFFIDIDGAAQPDGTWSNTALDLCARLNGCAVEVSQSGTGLHILGKGRFGEHRKKNTSLHIELYTEARFVALTGTGATGDVRTVIDESVAAALVSDFFAPSVSGESFDDLTDSPVPDWRGPTDDADLIRRACRSRSAAAAFGRAASFKDLWECNLDVLASAYPSETGDAFDRSSADAALASHLSFWTGKHGQRMLSLMRQSGLHREKWDDREGYLETTIINACAFGGDVCKDAEPAAGGVTGNGTEILIGDRQLSILDPLPHTSLNGKPKPVFENYKEVLNRADIKVRYDVIKKRVDIQIPGRDYRGDKQDVASIAWLGSLYAHYGLPRDGAGEYLNLMAAEQEYNPALEWIESKPWDGESRLYQWFDTIQTQSDVALPDGRKLRDVLMFRWALSAVGAIRAKGGFSTQGMLVITGEQGIGKSRWVESLAPADLELIRTGALLKPDDRDSVMASVRSWITEVGELDGTFRKADIAQLKSFITNPVDVVRLPYERAESNFARRTVFVATCNHSRYLVDDTGNRKFWTIAAASVNADHGLDMQQVWAEVLALWNEGHPAYLLEAERIALAGGNEEHEVIDPLEESIGTRLDWSADRSRWVWRTVTDVLAIVGINRPTRSDTSRAGTLLELRGVERRKSNGTSLRLVPPVSSVN